MANFTTEIIEKAKGAKTAHELLELAKAEGINITVDEAATYFAQLNPEGAELSDAELEVSGAVVFLKAAERIEVIVPEQATAPGTYVVSLEDLVLPEGVSLSELTGITLTVSANE